MQYPYYSPLVLTDSVFLQYGGQTGSSTQAQRNAAYLLAEMQVTESLSAFLVPTVVTGSAFWKRNTLYETEYGYLLNIRSVYADTIESLDPLTTRVETGTALIRNWEQGLLDVFIPCNFDPVYRVTVVYESGLSTGTVTQPDLLAGLVLAAQVNLNEWVGDLANEGVADVGVQKFSNQSYFEDRKYLLNTSFGNSATAQRIKRLLQRYKTKPSLSFHR